MNDFLVSHNVQMSENAKISWSQVSDKPYIPQTASDIGALPNNSPRLTYIDAYGIYTGTINANQIIAGSISADMIRGGTLSGVTINIDTDATIGRPLYLTGSGERSVVFKSGAIITTVPYGYAGLEISASDLFMRSGNVYIGTNPYTVYLSGNVDFSNATVKGLNVVAKFG